MDGGMELERREECENVFSRDFPVPFVGRECV
jgi:hypothetical protein